MVDTAIIDLRGPDPGAFHDAYRSWTIRARLERQEGHFPKNHVIWFGETPLIGSPNYTVQALKAMDRWLRAVERDHRRISLGAKLAQDRPADVHDALAYAYDHPQEIDADLAADDEEEAKRKWPGGRGVV